HFRDDALIDVGPPIEHVVIFDEAQRAWNLKQTASFMLRKKRRPGFSDSEPEFLISYLDRHKDWAVIVCLVGGGQEINTGEAGIDAWLDAANRRFPEWEMFISKRLTDTEYAAGRVLEIVRERARGTERYGLVASSKAMRLKPHAIDIRVSVDPVHYFLNEKEDTRSSYYLEDAATEFQVQGLELDWVCVAWCGDFRLTDSGWSYHDFRGDRWCNIGNADNRIYLRNAYRVLLTRARQGMIIFVPPGDSNDPTRS